MPARSLLPGFGLAASFALHAAAVGTALWISSIAPLPTVPQLMIPVAIVMEPAAAAAAQSLPPSVDRPPPAADATAPPPTSSAAPRSRSAAPSPAPAAALPSPPHKPKPPDDAALEPVAPERQQPEIVESPETVHTATLRTAPASSSLGPAIPPVTTAAASAATAVGNPVAPQFADLDLGNPPPEYPRQARRLGQEGTVLLQVLVSADGRALSVDVSASSGHPLLDAAAREAVARWRFHPARLGGLAVDGIVEVPVLFRLTE